MYTLFINTNQQTNYIVYDIFFCVVIFSNLSLCLVSIGSLKPLNPKVFLSSC